MQGAGDPLLSAPLEKILVSACLLGRPVRYDGRARTVASALLERWRGEGRLVPVCPEVIAGLPVPRPPAEIAGGGDGRAVLQGRAKIVENTGRDVTGVFVEGAETALRLARDAGCRYALLTDGSPSCGSRFVHDGSFTGRRVEGVGVVTALLQRNGITVFGEDRIGELDAALTRRTEISSG